MECKQAHKQRLFFNQFIAALSRLRQGVKQFSSWGLRFPVFQSDPGRNQKSLAVFQSDPGRNQKSLTVFQSDPRRNQKLLTVFQSDPSRNQKPFMFFHSDPSRKRKLFMVSHPNLLNCWKSGVLSVLATLDYRSPLIFSPIAPTLHGPSP